MTMAKSEIRFTDEEIKRVPLSDIFVDTSWNTRSLANVLSEGHLEGDTETSGIKGMATMLETDGQDTPIVVRASSDVEYKKNIKEPYALIAGFRRYAGAKMLNEPENVKKATEEGRTVIPNLANGTIKIVIRKFDDKGARLLNTRENTGREQLETPDLMQAVMNLTGYKMTTTDIGKSLGITQGYASRLGKIAGSLDREVFNHWRSGGLLKGKEMPNKKLGIDAIEEVSRAPKDRQVEAYETALKGAAEDDKSKSWWVAATKKAETNAKYIAGLCKAGLFDYDTPIDWLDLLNSGKFMKLHKEIKTKRQKEQLKSIAEKAFIAEYNRDENASKDDEDDEEEMDKAS